MLNKNKIKISKHALILSVLILVSFLMRIWEIQKPGYVVDEVLLITGGIKYFLPSSYNPSLYDNAFPGAKLWMGLFIKLFSDRDFSALADYGVRAFGIVTFNSEILKGLELYARMPSAIFGLIAGIFVYLLAREIYGKNAGLISFALFSFNPLILDYSRFALGEIYQIAYMMISIYFFYKSFFKKSPCFLIASAVFLGLCLGTKLNGLMVLPFFMLAIIIKNIKVKKSVFINYKNIIIKSCVLVFFSFFTLWAIVGFDLNAILEIINYYNTEGYNGFGFYFFGLIKEMFFYVNPLVWLFLIYSVYIMIKNREYYNFKTQFILILLLLFFCSTLFKTQSGIKRGIQFGLFIFIVCSRMFENVKNKKLYLLPLSMVLLDFILIMNYFPNTAIFTNFLCLSQECIENNALFYFDSRAAGEKINQLPDGLIYDTTNIEGDVRFYLNKPEYYLSSSILSWYYNVQKPDYSFLKENNFSYVIKNPYNKIGFDELQLDYRGCTYDSIKVKNFEVSRIYFLDSCQNP